MIDSGFVKQSSYDSTKRMTTLEQILISKAQAMQRRGRAGRTSPGICFRLYSEEEFERMRDDREPDILRTNSETVIMKILGLGIKVEEF